MKRQLRSALRPLAPPVFAEDPERTDAAALVHYGILFAFIVNVLTVPALVLAGDPPLRILLTEGTILGALAVHAVVLRRGHVRGAAAAFLLLGWAALAATNATAGGIRAPGFAIHILLVLCAGFLFGGRWVFLTAGASAALGFALLELERRGALPPSGVSDSPLRHWSILSASLVAAAAITTLMVRRLRAALAVARAEVGVRREAEAALARQQELLEEQVRARTAELAAANADLRASIEIRRRMEEDVLRCQKLDSVGVLAGGIAHDFNNLLTVILGNLSLARHTAPAGWEGEESLADAERAAFGARDLTQQLLTFSRGGAPVTRPTELRPLLEEAVRLALSGSRVRAQWSFPAALSAVDADPGQLGQVFRNIALNAAQAMPGGGTLRIGAADVLVPAPPPVPLAAGRFVRITLADDGPGIDTEHLPRLFDPYFTTRSGGSGLGLAVAHSVVRRHGGHIRADSSPGHGATFTIYLPARAAVPEPAETSSAPPPAGARGGRVLVMDDEPLVLRVAARALEEAGYEVATTEDGAAAVEAFREARAAGRRFDAVILDLTVPGGMGGCEALAKILEIDPGARAVVSSGYSQDPVMADPRRHGFAAVVPKPWRTADLVRTVAPLVRRD